MTTDQRFPARRDGLFGFDFETDGETSVSSQISNNPDQVNATHARFDESSSVISNESPNTNYSEDIKTSILPSNLIILQNSNLLKLE